MEFKLPEIGEGVVEGELIQWLVKDGDSVKADQALLEVMTDKATVEVPSPGTGVISGITAKDGQMIKVGQTLATIKEGGAAAAGAAQPDKTAPAKAGSVPQGSAPAPEKSMEKSAAAKGGEGAGQDQSSVSGTPAKEAPLPSRPVAAGPYAGAQLLPSDVPAAPIVRVMAQKAGVDLAQVTGSGPAVGGQNRVLEADLLRFMQAGSAPAPAYQNGNGATKAGAAGYAAPAPGAAPKKTLPMPASYSRPELFGSASETVERSPMRGLRRVIAQAMVRSKFTAPHYSYVDKFECSALVELREQAKVIGEQYGVKVSYLPFIVKALVGALKEFPIANSSLEEKDGQFELVQKKYFHIGVAVASPDGLIVPVIKHADRKTLLEIAKEINELSAKVRAGKAAPDELKGSTFTITSMGNVGGLFATPIINYPEVGIMGVYKIQEEPLVKDGQIVIGKTMHLSLSLDHRVVDGAVGGYFCNAVIERLQNPAKLLMELA